MVKTARQRTADGGRKTFVSSRPGAVKQSAVLAARLNCVQIPGGLFFMEAGASLF